MNILSMFPQSFFLLLNTIARCLCEEPDNNRDFTISRLTYWMRSAYVIKVELNTKQIFTDLEDNRVSINGMDNVAITVSWNSDIVESQTCSSTVLFLFFNPFQLCPTCLVMSE